MRNFGNPGRGVYLDAFAAGLGDPDDVHPRNKIPFAELALLSAFALFSGNSCNVMWHNPHQRINMPT